MIGSDFLHIMLYHYFNKPLKRSGLRIPTEFVSGFSGIPPKIYHISGTIKVF